MFYFYLLERTLTRLASCAYLENDYASNFQLKPLMFQFFFINHKENKSKLRLFLTKRK